MTSQQGVGPANIEEIAPGARPRTVRAWASALRLHQWVKNLLVFVPVVASHRWAELPVLETAALMFVSLSLCASALYLVNDILDVAADRAHPRKRQRPFASGALTLAAVRVAFALLLAGALAVGALLSPNALIMTALYGLMSGLYSVRVKRHAPLDVFFLAGLYVLRIIAGGVATQIKVTDWLLAFALFLFVGLAFCKRAVELRAVRDTGQVQADGRGYTLADTELVTACGIAASFTATLVLVLYLNSEQVRIMYRTPMMLWLLAPLILFWQLRLWMMTLRGKMHDDPVLFAARDRTTWIVGAAALGLILAAMQAVG
jgi:4-hydroxybenzoate polyprenyltransferase